MLLQDKYSENRNLDHNFVLIPDKDWKHRLMLITKLDFHDQLVLIKQIKITMRLFLTQIYYLTLIHRRIKLFKMIAFYKVKKRKILYFFHLSKLTLIRNGTNSIEVNNAINQNCKP